LEIKLYYKEKFCAVGTLRKLVFLLMLPPSGQMFNSFVTDAVCVGRISAQD
jgi:hypothetical protein